MLSFLATILFIYYDVTNSANDLPISPKAMQQFLQYINGDDTGLSCNLSSLNPAIVSAAVLSQGVDMDQIMSELSTIAAAMYTAAYQDCSSLDLSSEQCFQDCIYYNHPITLFQMNTSSPIFKYKLMQVLELYSVSGSPLGWYDIGNPDQCNYFNGQYCFTPLVPKDTEYPSITIPHGCCIPYSCQGKDAIKVVKNNNWCFKGFNMSYTQMFGAMGSNEVIAVCEVPERDTTSFGFIAVTFIFFMFLFLVLIASIKYQYTVQNMPKLGEKLPDVNDELNVNLNGEKNSVAVIAHNNMFLNVFSVQSIWNKYTIYRAEDKSQLNFLDGIRVYSMSWVILGHAYLFFAMSNGSNIMSLVPYFPGAPTSDQHTYLINKFWNIFVQYAFYSVDTFFWLSGLLGAFSIYRNVSKMGDSNKIIKQWYKWIPMSYFARYIRLVPMMFFATLIQWKISDQLSAGIRTIHRGQNEAGCSENWWKILFMISNLWLNKDGGDGLDCMGHLWYVQCDFQMYLLLPWLVLIFIKNKKAGIISSLIPFIICIIIRFYEGFYYHFGANYLLPGVQPIHDGNEGNQSYFKAWPRMAPYFIGVTLMFIMITINEWYAKHKNGVFILYKYAYWAVLLLSLFIMGCLVIWPYDDVKNAPERRWGLTANEIYYALCRPAWGVALSLLAFALRYIDEIERKEKSIIKQFLSFNIYQPIGKLTYTMYLIHMIVLSWWSMDTVIPPYYNGWFIAFLFLGVWFLTAMFAFILHMVMESPINSIVTLYLKVINTKGCCACFGRKRNGFNNGNVSVQLEHNINKPVEYNQYESEHEMGNFSIVKAGNI
eukprot:444424_1